MVDWEVIGDELDGMEWWKFFEFSVFVFDCL